MSDVIDLSKLAEPFTDEDVEWRVSHAGIGHDNRIFCRVVCYVDARAIQARLDDVCGPENWKNEKPYAIELRPGVLAFVCGISIRVDGEWITKWDLAEQTKEDGELSAPAKGGFSTATKRAGAQWGMRSLYRVKAQFAEVSDKGGKGWKRGRLPKNKGDKEFYWKPPRLPGWALPKDSDSECTKEEIDGLITKIREKLCPDVTNPKDRQETITRFIYSVAGEFPVTDRSCWTKDALQRCTKRIEDTNDPEGPDADVPFDSE
jgi:hypothetical protein